MNLAPLTYVKRANPCFVTGSVALAAEVAAGLPALEKVVTCDAAVRRFYFLEPINELTNLIPGSSCSWRAGYGFGRCCIQHD
jgi:hypothetical protein